MIDDHSKRCSEKAQDYRRKARDAMQIAERSESVEQREQLQKIAAEWLLLAEEVEHG